MAHEKLGLGEKRTVYVLMSKNTNQSKAHITKFVIDQGCIPSYPAMIADYSHYAKEHMDTKNVASDAILMRCNEVWVFGDADDHMREEIKVSHRLGKSVRYFDVSMPYYIKEKAPPQEAAEKGRKR
ncbi:MAG: hypothetical protein HY367_02435 [Candidatus Aenigmarchaeota archaeon]|nr:hypothetical protein [Candidatus Aenigmarchaeota archaeon]